MPTLHLENFTGQCVSKLRRRKMREAAAAIDLLAIAQHHAIRDAHRRRVPALVLVGITTALIVNMVLGGAMASGIVESFGGVALVLCLVAGPVALFLWWASCVKCRLTVDAADRLNRKHFRPLGGVYLGEDQVRLLPGYTLR